MSWNRVCSNPDNFNSNYRTAMERTLNALGITWEIVLLSNNENLISSPCPTAFLNRETCPHSHGSKYRVILRKNNSQFIFHIWNYSRLGSEIIPSICEAMFAGIYEFINYRNNNFGEFFAWTGASGLSDTDKNRVHFQSWAKENLKLREFFSAGEMQTLWQAFQGR